MTVAELIEKLREMPQDLVVVRNDREECELVLNVEVRDDLWFWSWDEGRSYRSVRGVLLS